MSENYTLCLSCVDQPGLVARTAMVLAENGGNIINAQQFNDQLNDRFFMRIVFELSQGSDIKSLHKAFAPMADELGMTWSLRARSDLKRVLLLVSRFDHCLTDLLYRNRIGELDMDIVGIISNHPQASLNTSDSLNIPFHHLPITKDTKPQQEAQIKDIVKSTNAELVVLARYMQILSDDMTRFLSGRCINIHHSFLPGFKGARPYHQAHERGVKMIGATAHYVTDKLDEGQIIEQDVGRVDHTKDLEDFVSMGRDIENVVLMRAIKWHLQHRVIINKNSTVVFN